MSQFRTIESKKDTNDVESTIGFAIKVDDAWD